MDWGPFLHALCYGGLTRLDEPLHLCCGYRSCYTSIESVLHVKGF